MTTVGGVRGTARRWVEPVPDIHVSEDKDGGINLASRQTRLSGSEKRKKEESR